VADYPRNSYVAGTTARLSQPSDSLRSIILLKKTLSACILLGVCCAPLVAVGQQDDHRNDHAQQQHYVQHKEWKRGYHMNHDDWNRGQQVDYRTYHLRQPPSGYEWRQVDGNYVMAAVATGIIASVVVASAAH
jgi:Ni/Co efflux regulator RcnB